MTKGKERPIEAATRFRQKIGESARTETLWRGEVSHSEGAMFLGVPVADLMRRFSVLVSGGEERVKIAAGKRQEIALEAIRDWRDSGDERFSAISYRSLYGAIQASRAGVGKKFACSADGLVLKAAEESQEQGMGVWERLAGRGIIDNEDLPSLGQRLRDLWQTLTPSQKTEAGIEGMDPNNLFS